jgi:hypothetical protein
MIDLELEVYDPQARSKAGEMGSALYGINSSIIRSIHWNVAHRQAWSICAPLMNGF